MLIKNISENPVLVRVLGIKQVVEAGQVVEVTDEEGKSHLALYSRIFEKSETMPEVKAVEPEEVEPEETKLDDTAVTSDEVIEEKTEEQKENTKTKKSSKKSETEETPETEEK